MSAMGPYKGLKQVPKLVEDCMHNYHPVYHIKARLRAALGCMDTALGELRRLCKLGGHCDLDSFEVFGGLRNERQAEYSELKEALERNEQRSKRVRVGVKEGRRRRRRMITTRRKEVAKGSSLASTGPNPPKRPRQPRPPATPPPARALV